MPTYEYQCDACGHEFEQRQAITAEPLRKCPQCGGKIRRLVSGGAGFIIKGGKSGSSCSFQDSGKTCCGLDQPCGSSACGDSP